LNYYTSRWSDYEWSEQYYDNGTEQHHNYVSWWGLINTQTGEEIWILRGQWTSVNRLDT